MSAFPRFSTALIAGAAVSLLGVVLGAWWAPFPAGIAIGVVVPRARWAALAGAVAGLVAWLAPLLAEQRQYGLAPAASSLAAIMGFNGAATIPVTLTLLVGLLLGLTGAWLGAAARGLVPRRLGPVQELRDKRLEVVDPVLAKR